MPSLARRPNNYIYIAIYFDILGVNHTFLLTWIKPLFLTYVTYGYRLYWLIWRGRNIPMKCPHCQAELPDNAKFCNRCSKSLQTLLICNRCHHPNPLGSSFCLQCGQPLTSEKVATPPAMQPPSIPTSFTNGH
jgi:predicted amidophosphoribosyltransferase